MKLSIIIPTYNRSDALTQTLENLSKQDFRQSWEAIVINNNSTDNTDTVVQSWQTRFPVRLQLILEKKPGAAAARNAGVRAANGEYLIFIDNDILVKPDFLQNHLSVLEENPSCWIVGSIVNLPEQENSPFGEFRKSLAVVDDSKEIREIFAFSGANSSMRRADFENLDGFDENFHVASGEDQELSMRARKQLGVKVLYAPRIVGTHNDWAGWTFADFCLRQRIYARTEFYFWQKYGNEHQRLQIVRESLPIDWKIDSLQLLFRKQIKKILSNHVSQTILLKLSQMLEGSSIFRPVLWQLYKLALAGAIHKGFCEGRTHVLEGKTNSTN